ncbi:MAG: ketopantoate reductase family protein [Lachnospiraceae bacterium]|nr:ketopantoate reductase family protein [Lachnospiraceae bacterium]
MKILVYGAGVIGCELAHELCKGKNTVTLLARGKWKENIDRNGLVIRHYAQFHTTTDRIHTIAQLKPDDVYDLIIVAMQYSQLEQVLPALASNKSKYFLLVGNNMNPGYCLTKIHNTPESKKEIAFGFQGTAGRREDRRGVSIHTKPGMTYGGLRGHLSTEFQNTIKAAFAKTGYQLKAEYHMEGWLLCHVAFILPICYVCYIQDGNLKRATKKQIEQIMDAAVEAHTMLKKLGYPIRPDGEEEYFTKDRKKNERMLYLMAKTPLGRLAASDHAMHAKGEMAAMDQAFELLRTRADEPMKAWENLRMLSRIENFKSL